MERQGRKKFLKYLPFFIVLPIITAILCIGVGKFPISVHNVLLAVIQGATGQDMGVSAAEYSVVVNLRLPRVLLAILAGASLTSAGCAFQAVFSNPLAAPDTLGVSAGAGFGACLGLLLDLPSLTTQSFAFIGGILAVMLTFLVSKTDHGSNPVTLILGGMAISALFQAGISMIQMLADPTETLPEITFWLMGSLSRANYSSLLWATPFSLIGIITLLVLRWRLNTLSLDETEATSLGIPVKKLRAAVVVSATFCTATTISQCGMIGWLGILAPHGARMLLGNDNRYVLPASISIGITALIVMDTLSRNLVSGVLPISVLTALVGAPIFIILLRKTGGFHV
ncbi:MAG: iron ABC transporter permease [Eubacteriales bacterium]